MSIDQNEYEETIAKLTQQKVELEKQVALLNERNRNQAMLLKRLDSARQSDRNQYEAQIVELKEALSQERIKTRHAAKYQNGPLSPSASQRSLMSSTSNVTPPRLIGEGEPRQVSKDDRKSWKDSTGGLTSSGTDRLGNTAQVQSALLGAAIKQKKRKQNKGGFWSLFGPTDEEDNESETAKRNAALLKKDEESRTSLLTKEIMQALEENKRVIIEREEELAAREEVQRVKEEAIRKNQQQRRLSEKLSSSFGLLSFGGRDDDADDEDDVRAPATADQVNMNNISKIRDSEVLDVGTLRRLIADRTAGIKEEDLVSKTSIVMGLEGKEEDGRDSEEEGSESEYGPEGDDDELAEAANGD